MLLPLQNDIISSPLLHKMAKFKPFILTCVILLFVDATKGLAQDIESKLTHVEQDVTTYQYHKDFKSCPAILDIGYLIDGSSSIKDVDFRLQKTIVQIMAHFFDIAPNGTHNAVIVYTDTVNAEIRLDDHYSFPGFRDAVKALRKRGGGTRIDVAIEAAHDHIFGPNGGARRLNTTQSVAIVFSGGETGGQSLGLTVQQLRDNDVITFAVAIGDKAATNDLPSLVDRPDLVFYASDFMDLYIKTGLFARLICQHVQNRGSAGVPGPVGPLGPPGPSGAVGAPGPDGTQGQVGTRGRRGERGEPGPQGADGLVGNPGASGALGPQGGKGPKGASGSPGAIGRRGEVGDSGYDGDQGARGAKGTQGNKGQKGKPGIAGRPGIDGVDGQPGPKGLPGTPGDKGDAGRTGTHGSNGDRGRHGEPGAQGEPGIVGAPGKAGVKGDRGPRGASGPRGGIGDPGTSGADGKNGANGDTGDPGLRGLRGLNGPNGEPGAAGKPGLAGADGRDGAKGEKGKPGAPGMNLVQNIVCNYKRSDSGQSSVSCNDVTTTAVDCDCATGCAEWSISDDGQRCSCSCNMFVPQYLHQVGINCCKIQ